jgi:hypothetical protein
MVSARAARLTNRDADNSRQNFFMGRFLTR